MKTRKLTVCAAAALVFSASVEMSFAQTWTGPYVGGTIGGAIQPKADDRIVRFDKTLDGDFSDTILTAGGVNAFGPGFCAGAAVNATPSGGCRADDRAPDFGVRARRRLRAYFGAGFVKASSATGALILTSVNFSVVT